MVSWISAVKQYAQNSGKKFAIPKKDSDEYLAIKALQQKMSESEIKGLVKEKKEKVAKVVKEEPVKEKEPVKQEPLVKAPTVKPVKPVKTEPAPQEFKPKKRVPKVRTVAEPEPEVEAPAVPDVPLVVSRKTKKQVKAEKVIPDTVVEPVKEVVPDVPLVVVRKTRKEKAQQKKAINDIESEKMATNSAKKALEQFRTMKFVDGNVVLAFD
jgi:hypothetical protein